MNLLTLILCAVHAFSVTCLYIAAKNRGIRTAGLPYIIIAVIFAPILFIGLVIAWIIDAITYKTGKKSEAFIADLNRQIDINLELMRQSNITKEHKLELRMKNNQLKFILDLYKRIMK